MTQLKYYKALNLFEGLFSEADQISTPLRDLSNKIGALFTNNPMLLKSVMNKFRSVDPDVFKSKIPELLNFVNTNTNPDELHIANNLINMVDEDTEMDFDEIDIPPQNRLPPAPRVYH